MKFRIEDAKEVKIIYKNGTTYTVKDPIVFEVFKSVSGGFDVKYVVLNSEEYKTDYGSYMMPSTAYRTSTSDVVSVEAKDCFVSDTFFSRIKQIFKR